VNGGRVSVFEITECSYTSLSCRSTQFSILWFLSRLDVLRSTEVFTGGHKTLPPMRPFRLLPSFFFSGKHHQECVFPNVDISLQSGRFWATSVASFRERLLDFRSCWIVFIHIVQGRPGGLLQFFKEEAVKIFLASVSSGPLCNPNITVVTPTPLRLL